MNASLRADVPSSSIIRIFLMALLVVYGAELSARVYTPLRGEVGIHDPSSIAECNGRYYVFGTGQGIISRSSADLVLWEEGPPVFDTPPAWATSAVPGFTDVFWAPDIIERDGTYYLYYSVSTWGSQVSAIGLATAASVDPSDPSYGWTDHGAVIQSGNGDPYNCIDPSVCLADDGRLWMAYGSYWTGIYVIELNPATGLRLNPGLAPAHVAFNSSIEAASLIQKGSYFYLFVNWGQCCSFLESTYNIRVGRSTAPTGPFLDRDGIDMRSSGGSLFLESTGRYHGPGHFAVHRADDGKELFGYHYYDAGDAGNPKYDLRPLAWSDDNWPESTNDWVATYRFVGSGRDDGGQFFGFLENGASIRCDTVRGSVVDLDGVDDLVRLPVGIVNARTFMAVVKWNGGRAWQRIFDFGRSSSQFCFLTPANSNGYMQFGINAGSGPQDIYTTTGLPVGEWVHVAVTIDGGMGNIYLNGLPIGSHASMTLSPHQVPGDNNTLGDSQFSADPAFNGQISSFRAYGRALSADEIVAPHVDILHPVNGELYKPGQRISFSGYATDFMDAGVNPENIEWLVEHTESGITNVVYGPKHGIVSGSFAAPTSGGGELKIHLSGMDGAGRTAQKTVTLYPDPTSIGMWMTEFPFENGALDHCGSNNGTLMNGATTDIEAFRGSVLTLDGVDDYVDLPDALSGMRTFSAWVKWSGGADWQRIFDLGTGPDRTCFLTASGPAGMPRFVIYGAGLGGGRTIDAPNPLPRDTWTHVAVVFDGVQVILYINGEAVAAHYSVNLLPSDLGGFHNYIGDSQFAVDPEFSGRMDTVLMSSQALDLNDFLPMPLSISFDPPMLTLCTHAASAGRTLHESTTLKDWNAGAEIPTLTNGMQVFTIPVTEDRQFFRMQFPQL